MLYELAPFLHGGKVPGPLFHQPVRFLLDSGARSRILPRLGPAQEPGDGGQDLRVLAGIDFEVEVLEIA